jgi:peroxiredoxin Q/BCP
MAQIEEGSKAPDFKLPGGKGLGDYKGRTVVLYFYPKDDTPGCTQEACDFRDSIAAFQGLDAAIIGISKDDEKKHGKFTEKYSLNFPLLADVDGTICETYGTWVEKSMYGKKYMGIDRATFLIDATGKVQRIWRKVKVPGHVAEVRQAIEEMKKKAA